MNTMSDGQKIHLMHSPEHGVDVIVFALLLLFFAWIAWRLVKPAGWDAYFASIAQNAGVRRMRPWKFSVAALFLSVAAFWFSMSCLAFDGAWRPGSLKTGGWFLLGMPMVAPVSLAYSLFVAYVARRWHSVAACGLLLPGIALLSFAIYEALPKQQLVAIVGEHAAHQATIEKFVTLHTLDERVTTLGIISGPPDLLSTIVKHRGLAIGQQSLHRLQDVFERQPIPDFGEVLRDEHAYFYRSLETGRIYFLHRDRVFQPPRQRRRSSQTRESQITTCSNCWFPTATLGCLA